MFHGRLLVLADTDWNKGKLLWIVVSERGCGTVVNFFCACLHSFASRWVCFFNKLIILLYGMNWTVYCGCLSSSFASTSSLTAIFCWPFFLRKCVLWGLYRLLLNFHKLFIYSYGYLVIAFFREIMWDFLLPFALFNYRLSHGEFLRSSVV